MRKRFRNNFHLRLAIRALNFAVGGYGAHHTLRQLEINLPRMIEPHDPLAIVFTVIPSVQPFRVAGRAEWDQNGPHYELVDGTLKYLGSFAGTGLPLWQRILRRSRIYAEFLDEKIRRIPTDDDRALLLAIILRDTRFKHEPISRPVCCRFMGR